MSDQTPDLLNTKFNFGNTVGILSINGDATSAQTLSGVAPVVVNDLGGGAHSIAIGVFDATHAGIVPASGGGVTNFLRADGTWAPAGGGGGGITSINGDITPAQTLSSAAAGSYSWIDNGVGDHKLSILVFAGGATPGLVPSAAGAPAGSFLRFDGVFAVPPGGSPGVTSINGDGTAAQTLTFVEGFSLTNGWTDLGGGAHRLSLTVLNGSASPSLLPDASTFSKPAYLTPVGWSARDIQQNNWGAVGVPQATPTVVLNFTASLPPGEQHLYAISANGGMAANPSGSFWILFVRVNGVPATGAAYVGSYRSDTNTQGQVTFFRTLSNGDTVSIVLNQEATGTVASSGGAASIISLCRVI